MSHSLNKKRALITGATGYIGSNLVRHLLGLDWDVHIITRPNSNLTQLNNELDSITAHQHDGTSQGMVHVLGKAKPDVVFHLASLFLAQHKSEDIEQLVGCNLLFSTQLVEAMAMTGVKYLVNTGTSWQHYNNEQYSPVNLYAATKQAFEDILTYYAEAHGLKVTTLILFDTYGPGDPRPKLISLLWKTAASQQPLAMSPGEQIIDLVYISDVVRAFSMAADNVIQQAYNHMRYAVSSGKPMRLIDLVAAFQEITKIKLPITFGGRPYRQREVMVPWINYETMPGWKALIPFSTGVQQARPL